jgi:hypothetical protein
MIYELEERRTKVIVHQRHSDNLVFMIITILNIFHSPLFYLKSDVSETGFYIVFRWNPLNWAHGVSSKTETSSIYWNKLSRFRLKTDKEFSLRTVVFLNESWDDK